jgi:signal transduction histidine kinase
MNVLSTATGEECLSIAKHTLPDLIVLDIVLPGIDGIETCKMLKSIPETSEIPIVFISVKSELKNKLEGLDAGAYDYITKPIDPSELLARVQTQLRIRSTHQENLALQHHLSEARHAATIGAVTQGIAHTINNLLGIALGYMDLIKLGSNNDTERLATNLGRIETALKRLAKIVNQLGSISNEYRPRIRSSALTPLLEGAVERFCEKYKIEDGVELNCTIPRTFKIPTSEEALESALEKVLLNAWESYTCAQKGPRTIRIEATLNEEASALNIRIKDHGCGIDEHIKNTLFEPFVSTKPAIGHGLGLAMAKHTLKQLGSTLTLESNPEGGTSAIIMHPVTNKNLSVN